MTRLDKKLEVHRDEMARCRRSSHPEGVLPIVSLARSPKAMLVGHKRLLADALDLIARRWKSLEKGRRVA